MYKGLECDYKFLIKDFSVWGVRIFDKGFLVFEVLKG